MPPEGSFLASGGSILGFQGLQFGPPRGACKESAPKKAQPSILGFILGSFRGPFGAPGRAVFERTSERFLVFLKERRTLGKVRPRVAETSATQAQPSILGSILGPFRGPFGVPGRGVFERTFSVFLCF